MSTPPEFYHWRPHPWHGLEVGPFPPEIVNAYVEITPHDLMKYEVDKVTGYTYIDRPQTTSSQPPALYGFIPRTYSGPGVGALFEGARGGDGDPLDICVLSERPIIRGEVIIRARVIGGLPMLDDGFADDKIIAVLHADPVYDHVRDIDELPVVVVDRLVHYFATYKMSPHEEISVSIGDPYDRAHAQAVIKASMEDYRLQFLEAGR
jgi:inorganic pyrophosphatase